MLIITRYLLKQFAKTWLLALFGFLSLYLVVDFVEKADKFLSSDLPASLVALYFLAQLPQIIYLMAPVASLVGVLVCLGLLARGSEIVAMKAAGLSMWRLSRSFIGAGIFIALGMFFLNNFVTPHTMAITNDIWKIKVKAGMEEAPPVEDVWLRQQGVIQYIREYNDKKSTFKNVELYFFNGDFRLERRLIAETGFWRDGRLTLHKVIDKQYQAPGILISEPGADSRENAVWGRFFSLEEKPELVLENWSAPPKGLGRLSEYSNEMSIWQLRDLIGRLKAEGFDPVRQEVDYYLKYSFIFVSLIMIIIGLPLALWKEKGGGIALGIALGLGLSFIYLMLQGLARSFGYSGLLPPIAAAWLPNLIFVMLAFYLSTNVRQ